MGRASFTTDDLNQWAVYWEGNGLTDITQPQIKSPVEIPCSWLDVVRDPKSPNDEALIFDVHMGVDRDIPEGSIFWPGKLEELPLDDAFEDNAPLYQVVGKDVTPNISATQFRRNIMLIRFGTTLPELDND